MKDPANPTQQIRALQMKPYAGKITEDILRRIEDQGVSINSIVGLVGVRSFSPCFLLAC